MQKLAQIHFEIPASQKKLIHKLAKNNGVSDNTYYHERRRFQTNRPYQKLVTDISEFRYGKEDVHH